MNVLAQLMMKDAAKRDTHYELQKSVNYWDLNVVCTFGIFLMVCLIQCHLVYMLLGEVDLIVCGMQSMLNTHFLVVLHPLYIDFECAIVNGGCQTHPCVGAQTT